MTKDYDEETGEVISAEIVPVSQGQGMALFGEKPAEGMARMVEYAKVLANVIEERKLYTDVPQKGKPPKKHVHVEGWTLLGTLLGVFPRTVSCDPVLDDKGDLLGFKATVEVLRNGQVIGGAVAFCMKSETKGPWKYADDYALASMAQTRAISKALRMPLGSVMQLAGYDPTPSDEVPPGGFEAVPVQRVPEGVSGKAAQASKDAPRDTNNPKDDFPDMPECPTCHKEAIRFNPTGDPSNFAYCWKKAGGCGKPYTKKVWDIVSVPGPSSLDPLPPVARHEAPADVQDLTDETNLPF